MAELVDGHVATGENAFQPGFIETAPASRESTPNPFAASEIPIDPALDGQGGPVRLASESPGSEDELPETVEVSIPLSNLLYYSQSILSLSLANASAQSLIPRRQPPSSNVRNLAVQERLLGRLARLALDMLSWQCLDLLIESLRHSLSILGDRRLHSASRTLFASLGEWRNFIGFKKFV